MGGVCSTGVAFDGDGVTFENYYIDVRSILIIVLRHSKGMQEAAFQLFTLLGQENPKFFGGRFGSMVRPDRLILITCYLIILIPTDRY